MAKEQGKALVTVEGAECGNQLKTESRSVRRIQPEPQPKNRCVL